MVAPRKPKKSSDDFETTTHHNGSKTVMRKGSKYMDDADYTTSDMNKVIAERIRLKKANAEDYLSPDERKAVHRSDVADQLKHYGAKAKPGSFSYDEMSDVTSRRSFTKNGYSMGRQDRPVVKQKKSTKSSGDSPFFKHTTKGKQ